jgi:hypothetical protein
MALQLHNPTSQSHIEELRDRLCEHLTYAPFNSYDDSREYILIRKLVDVVRSMDMGAMSADDALNVFAAHQIPGFSFDRWLGEMVDEGVYLEAVYDEAVPSRRAG